MTQLFQITLIKFLIQLFQDKRTFHANLIEIPRYGENPHQKSAIYSKNSRNEY